MSDLISRQAAIEEIIAQEAIYSDDAVEILKRLPSVQPKIIHCRDCKYGEQDEIGRWYCRGLGCQIGDDDGSGFCADAERRTDERID